MQDQEGVDEIILRLLPSSSTEGVYITVDKDVLQESDNLASYPGRQGNLTLNEPLSAISLIRKHMKIVGADVCGECSRNTFQSSIGKRLLLW